MLDLNPDLLLMVIVLFICLIIVLNRILYKPLLTFMDDRDKSIQEDMNLAKRNSGNVSHLEKESADILKNAKEKAFLIREEAIKNAKEKANKELNLKKEFLEKEYESFMNDLILEKDELKEKLAESLPLFEKSLKTKISKIEGVIHC